MAELTDAAFARQIAEIQRKHAAQIRKKDKELRETRAQINARDEELDQRDAALLNRDIALREAQKVINSLKKRKRPAEGQSDSESDTPIINNKRRPKDVYSSDSSSDNSYDDDDDDDSSDEDDFEFVPEPEARYTATEVFQHVHDALQVTGILTMCRFDVKKTIRHFVTVLTNARTRYMAHLDADNNDMFDFKELFGGGSTQSGKTLLKFVFMMVSYLLEISTVLVTTGLPGRNSLYRTLIRHLTAIVTNCEAFKDMKMNPITSTDGCVVNKDSLMTLIEKHGGVIVADVVSQVKKSNIFLVDTRDYVNPYLVWALILDESDAMIRSDNNTVQVEKAHEELLYGEFPPLVKLSVTATPLSVLMRCKDGTQVYREDIILTTPSDNYVHIEMAVPLMVNGKRVFLTQGELTKGTGFNSPNMEAMMEDANQNPRSLHLIYSCSRVKADVNTTDLAERERAKFPNLIVIVANGTTLKYRVPGGQWVDVKAENKAENNRRKAQGLAALPPVTPGCVIEMVEQICPDQPITFWAYKTHMRSFSIRSATRVPTHMTLYVGPTLSVETGVQAQGRMTGDYVSVLVDNGVSNVTVLMQGDCYDAFIAYKKYIKTLIKHMETDEHLSLAEAQLQEFPADANFQLRSVRPIAQKKANIRLPTGTRFARTRRLPRGARFNARIAGIFDSDEDSSSDDDDVLDVEEQVRHMQLQQQNETKHRRRGMRASGFLVRNLLSSGGGSSSNNNQAAVLNDMARDLEEVVRAIITSSNDQNPGSTTYVHLNQLVTAAQGLVGMRARAAWGRARQWLTSGGQHVLSHKVGQLVGRGNILSSGDKADVHSLIFTEPHYILEMDAMQNSNEPVNWMRFLNYQQVRPATENRMFKVLGYTWPGQALYWRTLKQIALGELEELLKLSVTFHEMLKEDLDRNWSVQSVMQLTEPQNYDPDDDLDVFEGYNVPLYFTEGTDTSNRRSRFSVLPLFVASHKGKLNDRQTAEAAHYQINPFYRNLISKYKVPKMKGKGKGKARK